MAWEKEGSASQEWTRRADKQHIPESRGDTFSTITSYISLPPSAAAFLVAMSPLKTSAVSQDSARDCLREMLHDYCSGGGDGDTAVILKSQRQSDLITLELCEIRPAEMSTFFFSWEEGFCPILASFWCLIPSGPTLFFKWKQPPLVSAVNLLN